MDFVVVAEVAMVAIFPNLATAGVEERVVTSAKRELDSCEASLRQGSLRLHEWFQCDHRKKNSDDCKDRLQINVTAHGNASKLVSGRPGFSIFESNGAELD